ncbi:MAG: nitroreductase family protein [Candidatus Thermoplasmatota archaeon]|nr:nitroreductase family protein [Candidatus Thermoplasmatota archaeon]
MKNKWVFMALVFCLFFLSCNGIPSASEKHYVKTVFSSKQYIELPPPSFPNIYFEESLARRMSVREFSDKPVSLENLSTLLWGVYGFYNGTKSIETFNGCNVIKVYVLLDDGVYRYNSFNHSLILFRNGDYRKIGQYDTAALKLGFVWDTSVCKNKNVAAAEMGMIGQNIYLIANALGLGTVTTAQQTNQLYLLGLPLSEKPIIIMQIGYPKTDYDFVYEPFESGLPFPNISSVSYFDAVVSKQRWAYLTSALPENVLSQVLWAGYGTSFFIDKTNNKRHRTVPSSHGTYPLEILFANASGLYKYKPLNHSLEKLCYDDVRDKIANASFSWVSSADVFIILLNKSKTNTSWAWYYEAGAIWHNMLLEAATFNLSSNVLFGFYHEMITSELQLTDYEPLVLIQIGEKNGFDSQPPEVTIVDPEKGYLYLFGFKTLIYPDIPNAVVIGKLQANVLINDDSILMVEFYINSRLIGQIYWEPYKIVIPRFLFKNCEFKVFATDYFGNTFEAVTNFIKIL